MNDDITDDDRAAARGIFATARRTGLFSHPTEPDEATEPATSGNHVAREGDNPDTSPKDPNRDFVGRLFGTDENARNLFTH